MADFSKDFLIRVRADIDQALKEMKILTGEMRSQGKTAVKENASLSGLSRSFTRLAAAAGAYISVQSAFKALRIADEYALIQTQIKRATKETGNYLQVSEALFDISQLNGTVLGSTVQLYRGLARAGRNLNASQKDVLSVTQAVQQTFASSGTSGAQLNGVMIQLSQLFAGTNVQAQEFNSLIDAAPDLVQAIADGMGVTYQQLLLSVKSGKVLVSEVFDALRKQAPQIAKDMADIPESIARSTTRMENSFARFLGSLNEATGTTETLAGWFTDISKNLDVVSEYINPSGANKFNLLLADRLDLQERIAKVQEDIRRQSALADPGPSTQRLLSANRFGLVQLEKQLAGVNKELQELSDQKVASIKAEAATEAPAATAPTADAGRTKREKALAEARRSSREATVQGLEQEAETYGMTAGEIALYRLEVEGATQAQLNRARAAIDSIAAEREFADAVKASDEAVKQQNADQVAYEAALDRQAQKWQDLVNPINGYQREIEELEQLYAAGKLSAETYAEATFRVQDAIEGASAKTEETTDKMSEAATQAAQKLQSVFGDSIFAALQGDFDSLGDSFKTMLDRMVADALAAQLAESLFGTGTTGATSGGEAGGFMALLASLFHRGGVVGRGSRGRRVNPLMFANAPRLHSGGLAGLEPSETPAILRVGEEVLRRDDPRHVLNGGGGGQSMNVTMNIQTPDANSFRSSSPQVLHEYGRKMQNTMRRNG